MRRKLEFLYFAYSEVFVFILSAGNGDYYCSGNDLNNFTNIPPGGIEKMAKDAAILLE